MHISTDREVADVNTLTVDNSAESQTPQGRKSALSWGGE